MFPCINFDEHFADFTSRWVEAHRKEYRNVDAMEADMPRIYMNFLNTPAKWLEGLTPGSYFTQYEDPKDLVDWLIEYTDRGVPVPDLLLEQIENVGKPCEKRLVSLLKESSANQDAKMTAVGLLRDMESTQPKMLYIQWQLDRQEDDELADNAMDSLTGMGRGALQAIVEALPRANDAGQLALLDAAVRYPGNEKVFQLTLQKLREHPEKLALLANYLSKLGDDRAVPELKRAALAPETVYTDYIELRNAIERLGGEAPEREYDEE